MRVGIIGNGLIGRQHMRSWLKIGVEVHAFSGRGKPATNEKDLILPNVRWHESVESLMDAVDIVDVCTPTFTHSEYVHAAAIRGCHVVCEKPISVNVEDAESMLDVCLRSNRRLFVAHVVRYFPEYEAIRTSVSNGLIGEVAVIRLAREGYRPNRKPNDWLFDSRRSGGIFGDLMIHDIDFAMWIAGPVVKVYAKAIRAASAGVNDHGYALLTHLSGALTHVTASWAQVRPSFTTSVEVAGSQGILSFDSECMKEVSVNLHEASTDQQELNLGLPDLPLTSQGDDPFTSELRDFLYCVETGAEPRVTAQDGIGALRVAVAVQRSSHSGTPIDLGSGQQ